MTTAPLKRNTKTLTIGRLISKNEKSEKKSDTTLSAPEISSPEALDCPEKNFAYLTEGGVFPEELIRNFIKTKRKECAELAKIPHPAEFDKYYNF